MITGDERGERLGNGQASAVRSVSPPTFELGRVRLRPFMPRDTEWLYSIESHPALIDRWRLNGRTPSPQEYQQLIWQTVLCQFVVEERVNGFPTGLVVIFNPDFVNGLANVALVADPRFADSSLVPDGCALVIDYVFRTWPFRKIYGESVEYNYERFLHPDSTRLDLTGLWDVEGVLKAHTFHDGHYWDKYIVSISRASWNIHRSAMLTDIQERALL